MVNQVVSVNKKVYQQAEKSKNRSSWNKRAIQKSKPNDLDNLSVSLSYNVCWILFHLIQLRLLLFYCVVAEEQSQFAVDSKVRIDQPVSWNEKGEDKHPAFQLYNPIRSNKVPFLAYLNDKSHQGRSTKHGQQIKKTKIKLLSRNSDKLKVPC